MIFLAATFGKQKKFAKVSLALWSIGFIIVILFASSKDDWIAIMGSIFMILGVALFLFKEITSLFWEIKRDK